MSEARSALTEAAIDALRESGFAGASARRIAQRAGCNQALVFYHFGSMDELLAAACRYGAGQAVERFRPRLAGVGSLAELLAVGRQIHEEERAGGHVALLGQLLAGAQTQEALRPATAAGLDLWIAEIETVLVRVLAATPFGEFADPAGDGSSFKTVNPADEQVLAEIAEAGPEDVDRAVAAARRAYDRVWSRLPGREGVVASGPWPP